MEIKQICSTVACNSVIRMSLFIILTLLSRFSMAVPETQQDVGSPLRVAQCRAACLETFSNERTECLEGPDCLMCWEYCELLQSNSHVWSTMCDEEDICHSGCQRACRFHAASAGAQQAQPVIRTQGEAAIRMRGERAHWPRPPNVQNNTPLIYIVMRRRDADGAWRQIIQTAAQSARIPSSATITNTKRKSDEPLRVLVVDSHGLVKIYSPMTENVGDGASSKPKKTVNTELKTKVQKRINSPLNKWNIHEISLIHQKFLVISEITWEPKAARGVYLVTWEVDGGGLKGNLFTDSTSVTLSLWPDTIYHIQVELVSHKIGIDNLKSEMLDLDTRRAQKVSSEPDNIELFANGGRVLDLIDFKELKPGRNSSQSPLLSMFMNVVKGENLRPERENDELITGFISAIILFLVFMTIVIWRHKRYFNSDTDNLPATFNDTKKHKLVEEFSTNNGTYPKITLVSRLEDHSRRNPGTTTNYLQSREGSSITGHLNPLSNTIEAAGAVPLFLQDAQKGARSEVQV